MGSTFVQRNQRQRWGDWPVGQPTTTQKLVITSKALKANKTGRVRASVSCPRTNGLCEGTLRLLRKGKVLSTARFVIRGGRSGKVTLKLSKKALKALGKSKRVKIDVFSRDLAGAASTSSKTVKLSTS